MVVESCRLRIGSVVALAAVLVMVPLPSQGHGQSMDMMPNLDKWFLSVGPMAAWAWDDLGGNGAVTGGEFTAGWGLLWSSLGYRALLQPGEDLTAHVVSAELGIWLFVNVGIGYDYVHTQGGGDDHGMHIFGGFPFPILGNAIEGTGLALQPYARVTFLWGERDTLVIPEAGLMLKIVFHFDES